MNRCCLAILFTRNYFVYVNWRYGIRLRNSSEINVGEIIGLVQTVCFLLRVNVVDKSTNRIDMFIDV